MMNVDPAVFILLAEVGGVALLLMPAMFLIAGLKRRKERQALQAWVEEILRAENEWRKKQEAFLQETCGQDPTGAATAATEMLKSRNQLYKCFIDAYFRRQPELLKTLPASVENFLETCRGPAAVALTQAAQAAPAAPDESAVEQAVAAAVAAQAQHYEKKVTQLEVQNAHLRQKLDGAHDEMKQMMGEYVSAFRGTPPAPPASEPAGLLLSQEEHLLITVAEAEATLQAVEPPPEPFSERSSEPSPESEPSSEPTLNEGDVDIDKLLESMTRTSM